MDDSKKSESSEALRERQELEQAYIQSYLTERQTYGQMILDNDRIDLFVTEILGYTLEQFHDDLLYFQSKRKSCLIMAPRGSGKSTIGTGVRVLFELLKNPDIRILIVSNTQGQAEVFLREIKNHIEGNQNFIECYGNLVGSKWDNKEIDIATRKSFLKESNVTALGVGGAVVGRHYDLIMADDLVDEENSRTELQRERLRIWFYKVLMPTLVNAGRIFMAGTRYYPSDLYGYLIKNDDDFKNNYIVFPAILNFGTEFERSLWEDELPLDMLYKKKKSMGTAIFDSQYMNDVNAMEGKIFKFEDFKFYEVLPPGLRVFQGVDLAISQKETADYFVIVTIGKDQYNNIYLIDVYKAKLTFLQQTEKIKQKFLQYDPIRVFIEANAYQNAQVQMLLSTTDVRVRPVLTQKDKVTRAWHLAHKFESGMVYLPRWGCQDFSDQMIAFPDVDHDDMFDGFEIAVSGSSKRTRRSDRAEPGLL